MVPPRSASQGEKNAQASRDVVRGESLFLKSAGKGKVRGRRERGDGWGESPERESTAKRPEPSREDSTCSL